MKTSVCVTTYNEERSIRLLLDSLLEQTKKPSEIIIVDAGSTDQTIQLIKYYQKKHSHIKLYVEKYVSRAKGRNMAIEKAENEVVAMTDAGCVADKDWLAKIVKPLEKNERQVAAGFYRMTGRTPIQKTFKVFFGVLPKDFTSAFLPSTRSVAFTKSVWKEIGGFSERLEDTAEDTKFNYDAVKKGIGFKRVKKAIVGWEMPESYKEGVRKLYNYAIGDINSGIWYHPAKGLSTHNIKFLFKFVRVLFLLLLFLFGYGNPILLLIFTVVFLGYSVWSFYKVYKKTDNIESGLWGIPIQFASDFITIPVAYKLLQKTLVN